MKPVRGMSLQSRSGGAGGMQKSGYAGEQLGCAASAGSAVGAGVAANAGGATRTVAGVAVGVAVGVDVAVAVGVGVGVRVGVGVAVGRASGVCDSGGSGVNQSRGSPELLLHPLASIASASTAAKITPLRVIRAFYDGKSRMLPSPFA